MFVCVCISGNVCQSVLTCTQNVDRFDCFSTLRQNSLQITSGVRWADLSNSQKKVTLSADQFSGSQVYRYYYANLSAITHCKIPKKTNKRLVPFLSALVLELNCQVGLALISLGENTVGRSKNLQVRHWEGKLPLLFCVLPITLPLFDHQCGKKERKRQEQRQIGCWFTFAFF